MLVFIFLQFKSCWVNIHFRNGHLDLNTCKSNFFKSTTDNIYDWENEVYMFLPYVKVWYSHLNESSNFGDSKYCY